MIARTLVLLLALTAPALADDGAAVLLGAIDVPLTPETLAAAGLDEARATAVARDATARRYLRVRAAGALGVLGTDGARRTLEALAAEDADVEVRIQAVTALARVWAPRDPAVAERLRALRTNAPRALDGVLAAELRKLDAQSPR
jgi:hypothetical protein